MTPSREADSVRVDLSRSEQWVVHYVMLDSLGLTDPAPTQDEPPTCSLRVLEKLETGRLSFTPLEVDHIRHTCGAYMRGAETPDSDRTLAAAVVERLADVEAMPPSER